MESWTLQILDEKNEIAYEEEGKELPSVLNRTWNGKNRSSNIVEGTYSISVTAAYAKGDISSAASGQFLLDVSPPNASVTLAPKPFSPDNDGINDELRIQLNVSDKSEIPFWEFMIYDRKGRLFTEFSGEGIPAKTITWDGRSNTGDLVVSAEDYPFTFVITDIYKNSSSVQGLIPVDILLIRDGDRLKVRIQNITFLPDSPKLVLDTESDQGKKNREVLIRLAEIFSKYGSYKIRIEGHAVNISGTEREEKEELQPLSLSRAQVVKEALVELGIEEDRIAVLGRGGTEAIVPHTDIENRWKNRRVEFILIK
jgi:gliding motility-associated-like protein